jgi:hypothetical protein
MPVSSPFSRAAAIGGAAQSRPNMPMVMVSGRIAADALDADFGGGMSGQECERSLEASG